MNATDLKSGLNIVRAVADAIRELKQVPSGMLYAQLMGVVSLEQYEKIIGLLIGAGLMVRHQSHLLEWSEPVKHGVAE